MTRSRFVVVGLVLISLAAVIAIVAANPPRAYVGTLKARTERRIELERVDSSLSVGFVMDASAARALSELRIGDEVRAVIERSWFSGATGPGNRLVSIRRCRPVDEECAADRARERGERQLDMSAGEEILRQHSICHAQMQQALSQDARYLTAPPVDDSTQRDFDARYAALSGGARDCATSLIDGHVQAMRDACARLGCGKDIGGGCSHIAGYIHVDAFRQALLRCGPR